MNIAVRKSVGSNPTGVTLLFLIFSDKGNYPYTVDVTYTSLKIVDFNSHRSHSFVGLICSAGASPPPVWTRKIVCQKTEFR